MKYDELRKHPIDENYVPLDDNGKPLTGNALEFSQAFAKSLNEVAKGPKRDLAD